MDKVHPPLSPPPLRLPVPFGVRPHASRNFLSGMIVVDGTEFTVAGDFIHGESVMNITAIFCRVLGPV